MRSNCSNRSSSSNRMRRKHLRCLYKTPLSSLPRDGGDVRGGSSFFLVAILRRCVLCGECLCTRSPLRAFAQQLVEQGFIDELSSIDRLVDFLRGAGSVDQELVALDAIFAVRAKQLQ